MSDHTTLLEQDTLLERLAPGGAEDFITEVFCWILQQEGVGNSFFEFLLDEKREWRDRAKANDIISGIKEGECSWSTQESRQISSGVVRLDMICKSESESGEQALIFEHKTWAHLHANQLENYRQVGKEYDKPAPIILITARPYQKEQNPDLHFLWRDVYSWLDNWLDEGLCKRLPDKAPGTDADTDNANLEFVCRNFLTLLKQLGLGPMPPITKDHFEAFGYMHDAEEGKQRIKKLLEAVKDRWPQIAPEAMKKDLRIKDRWGRIGCDVLQDWRPGIFIGVLYDGTDHKVELLDKNTKKTILDAWIILDMQKYPEYQNNPHYKELVKRLTEKWPSDESAGSAAWRTYHHLDAPNPNRWHPIHIRRKLEGILLAKKSGEEQADAFFEAVKEVVEFIVGLEDFWKLRENLARQDHANGE